MSAEKNKAFIRRYLDALSGKEKPASVVEQFVSDESLKQHIAEVEVAFPRYELIVEDMIAEGDRVVVRFTGRMIHGGPFLGIPPTGRQVILPGIILYRIAEGKIAEHWMQIDTPALMEQLMAGAAAQPVA